MESIDGTGSVSITKTTPAQWVLYRTRVVVTTGVDKIDATSTRTPSKNLERLSLFCVCPLYKLNPQNKVK